MQVQGSVFSGRLEDEGTPPAEHDGFLSGEVSPSYHSDRVSNGMWGPRTLQTRPSFKIHGHSYVESQKAINSYRPAYESEATAVDLIALLEENWYDVSLPRPQISTRSIFHHEGLLKFRRQAFCLPNFASHNNHHLYVMHRTALYIALGGNLVVHVTPTV